MKNELQKSSEIALRDCLNLQSHENLLVLTDDRTQTIGEALFIVGKKIFWLQLNGTRHTSEALKRPTFPDIHSCPIKILDRIDREVLPREFQLLCTIVGQTHDRFL